MSKIINCVLIDDEQLAIDTLKWQLTEFCDSVNVVATFTNPSMAFEFLKDHTVDLCFLDIDMPEMSGFEFINLWTDAPPFDVIFATAYSEYAIKAFKVSAVDYLLKPIDEEDLIETINKYRLKGKSINLVSQLEVMMQYMQAPKEYPVRIALPTQEATHLVEVEKIIRLQADNNYTTVHIDNGKNVIVSKTLKELEKLLDPKRFLRIHQSHTIDLQKVKMYQRGRGGNVTLIDDTVLPVSKSKKDLLLKRLGM